ncbi:fused MFS/spermidine synthase [Candidatus Poribacteria bacterium]|nr:fused MFS/spermidine synthase [Candidatus Poribacteria bacterium]
MKKIIYTLFALSGLSALIFEIVWTRQLNLLFGVTTYAVTMVLAIFMAGLAIGSIIWGKISKKHRSPLLLFGELEFGIGIFGLLFPFLINWLKNLYPLWTGSSDNFIIIETILCTFILIIPTILMGGTLPLLYRYFELTDDKFHDKPGMLYSLNTAGGVAGIIFAGFFLFQQFGVFFTNIFAGTINILIAIIALYVHKKITITKMNCDKNDNNVSLLSKSNNNFLWLTIFAISGFCGMSYEIIWTRILVLIISSTTYAFSLMLIVFLLGIAIGSGFGTYLVNRYKKSELILGLSEIFIGIYTLFLILIIGNLAEWFFIIENDYKMFGTSWNVFIFAQFILFFTILFPISFSLGIVFPAIIDLVSNKDSSSVGKIYAWNTWGSVIGSLITGFLLIQFIGIKKTILILVIINFSSGLLAIFQYFPRLYKTSIFLSILFIVLLIPAFSGDITFGKLITRGDVDIIFHHEDAGAIIEVYEYVKSKYRILVTDRHQREGGTDPVYIFNQCQQGYLPLLIHSNPKKILGLGLGSGITFSVVENFNVDIAEVAELSDGIIKSLKYFEPENRQIKDSKKIKIHKADARNFVLLTHEKYDIIMSELFVPYQAGVGNLYSYEHFMECKNKLLPGGMMWQWIPIAQISGQDLEVIINTFRNVFPNTTIWLTRQSIALLGTMDPLVIDFQKLNNRINSSPIKEDLAKFGLDDSYGFLALFQTGKKNIKKTIITKKINSDDYPFIEFNAPKYFYAYLTFDFFIENMNKFIPLQEDISHYIINIPEDNKNEILQKLKIKVEIKKYELYAQTYFSEGKEEAAVLELEKIFNFDKEHKEAKNFLEDYYVRIGWRLYKQGEIALAKGAYAKALKYNPESKKIKYYIDALK